MSNRTPPIQDMSGIRGILEKNLPWSPLDFVRGISGEGDRAIFSERLTRPIPEENDLRFVSPTSDGEQLGVFAERLAWDSAFFGFNTARLDGIFPLAAPFYRPNADYSEPLSKLLERAKEKGIKYLFAPVESRDLALLRALGNAGFVLIETRLYYYKSLKDFVPKRRYPVRMAKVDDIESLCRAASDTVNLYDRFHADPFIAPADAGRLMSKWIEASIKDGFADFMLVPDVKDPGALMTTRCHKDLWDRWGIKLAQLGHLAVAAPDFQGWGLKLGSENQCYLRDMGVEYSYHSTQITNLAMIRLSEYFNFHLGKGEQIFRIIL